MEQVFVVERARFFEGSWPQGFLPAAAEAASMLAAFATAGFFADRATAEQNPAWKQLIPYCVLRRPDAVFCVQRKAAQQEARLHRLLSIGIGGHINPDDGAGAGSPGTGAAAFFLAALWRELHEELHGLADLSPQPVFRGLLNDDSNEVGKVHLGLVYSLDVADGLPGQLPPRIREVSKMTGGFRSLAELDPLWQDPGRFESWSRLLFQAGLAGGQPDGSATRRPVNRAPRTPFSRPENSERNTHG